jgi:hypothetical protein
MSDRKYQKMVCDITELKARNGKKVYLEIIKDLATKQVLTWAISEHPNLHFALISLQKLLNQLHRLDIKSLYILIKDGITNIRHGESSFVKEGSDKVCLIGQLA